MTNESATRDDLASDLLMALLAVNSWTLEQVGRLYPSLQQHRLFDVAAVSRLDVDEVRDRLTAAGYKRGPVLGGMMALRMHEVALALVEGGAQLLADFEASGNTTDAREFLLTLSGVGPVVVENYFLLRSSSRS